jgi:hypothetical protein
MTYDHQPARVVTERHATSGGPHLGLPIAPTSHTRIPVSKRSGTQSAKGRATFAAVNEAKPSSELVAKHSSAGRGARVAKEQEMAALCQRRASLWADAIRNGLDPDIARFIRDQATAWRLLANSYALSAREAAGESADAH